MAVNWIEKSSKVTHAQAKQAYMKAIKEAGPEVHQDPEAHRQALANDAAHRLVLRKARLQDPEASGSAPAMREVGRPTKRAATKNASLDQGAPPRKRSRALCCITPRRPVGGRQLGMGSLGRGAALPQNSYAVAGMPARHGTA
jgi:hypothetical protein